MSTWGRWEATCLAQVTQWTAVLGLPTLALNLNLSLQLPWNPRMSCSLPPIHAMEAREKVDIRKTAPTLKYMKVLVLLKYREQPAFFELLFGALCSARHFVLFKTHNHIMKEEILVQTFYRWENGSLERFEPLLTRKLKFSVAVAAQGAEPACLPRPARLVSLLSQPVVFAQFCSWLSPVW